MGLDCTDAIHASAKTGVGIETILEAIVHKLPAPKREKEKLPLRALIFDSYYDTYRGVVVFFRVVDGEIRKGDKIRFMASGIEYEVLEVGVMTPVQVKVDVLRAGEVPLRVKSNVWIANNSLPTMTPNQLIYYLSCEYKRSVTCQLPSRPLSMPELEIRSQKEAQRGIRHWNRYQVILLPSRWCSADSTQLSRMTMKN